MLYPYLTIHMRELGINVEETAIMSAVTPVVSIVMPPLAGMLADKMGNFRVSNIKHRWAQGVKLEGTVIFIEILTRVSH